MNPLITIITITYNSEQFLQETIDSVFSQDYPHIEYIVVDGGSRDETVDIIKKNERKISKWISEPDEGIADAMNKGLRMMTGDYVIFIHSDDYLKNDRCITDAVELLDDEHDIFAFSILFKTKDGIHKRSSSWNKLYNLKTKLFHQGVLCKKSVFDEIGLFDTQFHVAMDYDLFLRAYRSDRPVKVIPEHVLSVMRDTGVSSKNDWESLKRRFAEEKTAHHKNSTGVFMNLAYGVYWLIYPIYRKLMLVRST